MAEDLNYIMAAKQGHVQMFEYIFGPSNPIKPETSEAGALQATGEPAPPLTPAAFDGMFVNASNSNR